MDFAAAAAYNPDRAMPRPYVRFEMRAVEDRTLTTTDGVTQMKDVPWAIVSAPGSRDTMEKTAEDWLASLIPHARDGRIPASWPSDYRGAFDLWIKGEEMPVHGTPIKSWPPLTPSQRKNIIAAGILTVQDLAAANEETRARIGMGALALSATAVRWLQESKDVGATAKALAEAQVQLADMKNLVAEQSAAIAEMRALLPAPVKK